MFGSFVLQSTVKDFGHRKMVTGTVDPRVSLTELKTET